MKIELDFNESPIVREAVEHTLREFFCAWDGGGKRFIQERVEELCTAANVDAIIHELMPELLRSAAKDVLAARAERRAKTMRNDDLFAFVERGEVE